MSLVLHTTVSTDLNPAFGKTRNKNIEPPPTLKELQTIFSPTSNLVEAVSIGFATPYELGRNIKYFNSFSAGHLNS